MSEPFVDRGVLRSLIAWTFPGIFDERDGGKRGEPDDERGVFGTVLASTSRVVQAINDVVFKFYKPGAEVTESLSADELLEDRLEVPIEVLNTSTTRPGCLRVGCC